MTTLQKIKGIVTGESHGLVVKTDGSRSRGHGFEPRHQILEECNQCQLLHTRNK
jgi:hypothetical protein